MPLPITRGALSARGFGLFSAPATVLDPFFPYVTMLLHGDGTNGAQNNTFLDSSTNNFTITRNGNTTQGSFSPYGSNWSNYFDGSTAWFSVASNAAFGMGTGDCTLECWYFPINSTVGIQTLIDIRTTNTAVPIVIGVLSTGIPYAYNGTTYSGGTVTNNAWNHIAFVRNGSGSNNCKLYLNGSQVAQFTDANDWGASDSCAIGRNTAFNGEFAYGYISNARVVKGTAVYTSAFTPSTTPLTAISGTSLLTCQSNRFIDNSTNNFAITVNGDTSVQRFSPFSPSAAYSTSVIGGSGYFDGSGDYLSVPSNAAFQFGTGDFTIECWFFDAGTSDSYPGIISSANGWSTGSTALRFNNLGNRKFGFFHNPTGDPIFSSTNTFASYQWCHVAVSRSGSTLKMFVNGVQEASATVTASISLDTTTGVFIGSGFDISSKIKGYVSDVRVVKGTAVYTSAFTPPTAPVTAITNTSLLTNFTNGGIFDNAMMNNLETVGNAQISTSVVKYGTGSLAFDGSGDYLVSNPANSNLYAFGTGDFTIEFWLNGTSVSSGVLIDFRPAAEGLYPALYLSSGEVRYYVNAADRISGGSLSTSNWYHIAIARSGTSSKLFVNGTQVGSTYTDNNNYALPAGVRIGIGSFSTGPLNGYIDDLRITKGYARYTANFTPPTAAFPNQ
jgi:hypothetical protein